MSFALRMRGVADKLLNKYDERTTKIQLKQKGVAVWDDTLKEMVLPDDASVDIAGVAVPYSVGMINGTTIQNGDIRLSITNGVKPEMQDKVLLDSKEYSIVSITPVSYTGEELNIMYSVQLRA